MQIFLFIIGAVAFIAGIATIGYGIPINQFSFGNTLIVVGTIAAIGGLIVIALGAVVSRLQQLGKAVVAAQSLQRFDRSDLPQRIKESPAPIKPEPKTESTEPVVPEPRIVAPPLTKPTPDLPRPDPVAVVAPVLRNPAAPSADVVEEKTSAGAPMTAPPLDGEETAPAREKPRRPFGFLRPAARKEPAEQSLADSRSIAPPPVVPPPAVEPSSRAPEETHFETVWPAESKPDRTQYGNHSPAPESRSDLPEPSAPASEDERPQAAILKSGVVDGMAYTLYVDGSIEAELPQGTLRFASINDLRAHLEKTA